MEIALHLGLAPRRHPVRLLRARAAAPAPPAARTPPQAAAGWCRAPASRPGCGTSPPPGAAHRRCPANCSPAKKLTWTNFTPVFDPPLVLRGADPGRVHDQAAGLRVLQPLPVPPRLQPVRLVHHRLEVVRLLCPVALCGRGDVDGPGSRREGGAGACPVHITLAPERGCFLQPHAQRGSCPMLEKYFVKPQTVDRIRASWIGAADRAVRDLAGRAGLRRQERVAAGAAAGRVRGVRPPAAVPGRWRTCRLTSMPSSPSGSASPATPAAARPDRSPRTVRGPVEQMLTVVAARLRGHRPPAPRAARSPRGPGVLRVPGRRAWPSAGVDRCPTGITWTASRPTCARIGVAGLEELSPALLSAFVAERAGAGLAKTTVRAELRGAARVPALRAPRRRAGRAT